MLVDSILIFKCLATWEICNTFILFFVLEKLLRVNTFFIVDTSIKLSYTYKFSPLFHEEFWSPITDITKTLNKERFSSNSRFHSQKFSNFEIIEDLSSTIKNSQASRLSSPTYTTQVFEFSSRHCISIDIFMTIVCLISWLHPTHFSLWSTNIWARDIDSSSYWIFFG